MTAKHRLKLIFSLGLSLSLTALFLVAVALAQEPFPEHVHNVSRTEGLNLDSGRPFIAAISDTMIIVWSEGVNDDELVNNRGHIYLQSASENDGFWRPTMRVHTSTVQSLQPLNIADMGANPRFSVGNPAVPGENYAVHLVWANGFFNTSGGIENISFDEINYARCDVSQTWNDCSAPVVVAKDTTNSDPEYNSPTIAQDDNGNLHVVWVDNANPSNSRLLYSRKSFTGTSWSQPQPIANSDKGQNPVLNFSNGRLHLVWDQDDDNDNAIKYSYDNNLNNNTFDRIASQTWDTFFDCYANGDPANPDIISLPGLNLLYLTFDIEPAHPAQGSCSDTAYVHVYASSATNGGSGSASWKGPFGIPVNSAAFDTAGNRFESNTLPTTGGLKPTIGISYTAPLTWNSVQVQSVWHFEAEQGILDTYQINYANGAIQAPGNSNPGAISGANWNGPFNVTNPDTRKTAPTQKLDGTLCNASSVTDDSAQPSLGLTFPAAGGQGNRHLVYQERQGQDTSGKWDVCYKGVINATVDPDYIQDDSLFAISTRVDPRNIYTNTDPYPASATQMEFEITIENKGDLDVVGLAITNTILNSAYIGNIVSQPWASAGTASAISEVNGQLVFTWSIDRLAIGESVTIEFALENAQISLPTVIHNRTQLWNVHLGSKPVLLTKWASATFSIYKIYMPVLFKS